MKQTSRIEYYGTLEMNVPQRRFIFQSIQNSTMRVQKNILNQLFTFDGSVIAYEECIGMIEWEVILQAVGDIFARNMWITCRHLMFV